MLEEKGDPILKFFLLLFLKSKKNDLRIRKSNVQSLNQHESLFDL